MDSPSFHFKCQCAYQLSVLIFNLAYPITVPLKSKRFCNCFLLVFILIIQSSLLVCKNILRHSMQGLHMENQGWGEEFEESERKSGEKR